MNKVTNRTMTLVASIKKCIDKQIQEQLTATNGEELLHSVNPQGWQQITTREGKPLIKFRLPLIEVKDNEVEVYMRFTILEQETKQ